MRILCTGDWHFGLTVGGYDFHDDLVRAVEVIMHDTITVDLMIVYGDIFHNSTPTPRDYASVMRLLNECKAPVVLLTGNHDVGVGTVTSWSDGERNRIPTPSALEPFKAFQFPDTELMVVDRPGILPMSFSPSVEIFFAPFITDTFAREEVGITAQEWIKNEFRNAKRSNAIAGFCHLDMTGVSVGSEQAVMRGGVLKMPSTYKQIEFPLINGHIHKRQTIGNVILPGSIVATDFSDIDGKWGYMILEVN